MNQLMKVWQKIMNGGPEDEGELARDFARTEAKKEAKRVDRQKYKLIFEVGEWQAKIEDPNTKRKCNPFQLGDTELWKVIVPDPEGVDYAFIDDRDQVFRWACHWVKTGDVDWRP